MDWVSLIAPVLAAIISGLCTAFVLSQRTGHAYQKLLMSRIETLEAKDKVDEQEKGRLRTRISELEREVAQLRMKLQMLESVHQDLPIPMWLKGSDGTMLIANKAYERVFLLPLGKTLEDYVGFDDFAVWPDAIANQYRAHDRKVLDLRSKIEVWEPVQDENGETEDWFIIKYPQMVANAVIGVAGIAIAPRERLQG